MIAVLADDFTGAAEIAAVGRRYGLTAEVQTSFQPTSATLVVVDTLTRSCTRQEAARRVAEEAARLRDGGVQRIHFKKVDSVLRGHVVAELSRLLRDSGLRRALLAPANPSFGQVIRDRLYSIAGRPLTETRFADDPEYPATSDDVLELLAPLDGVPVAYRENGRDLPATGIVVTGGLTRRGLISLAAAHDGDTLAAGGAEFFDVMLQLRLGMGEPRPPGEALGTVPRKTLLVLGSATRPGRTLIARAMEAGTPVALMPKELYEAETNGADAAMSAWADGVLDALAGNDGVVVAVDALAPAGGARPRVDLIPTRLAAVARAVSEKWSDELHLCVSGGTTASMVVRRLGWSALRVTGELGHGVVALRVPDRPGRVLTVKPGNYPWPDAIVRALT